MNIAPEITCVIPFVMVLVSAIVLFRVKTNNLEDTGTKIAMFMAVCAVAVLLFITVYAFKLIC